MNGCEKIANTDTKGHDVFVRLATLVFLDNRSLHELHCKMLILRYMQLSEGQVYTCHAIILSDSGRSKTVLVLECVIARNINLEQQATMLINHSGNYITSTLHVFKSISSSFFALSPILPPTAPRPTPEAYSSVDIGAAMPVP
jgi:hypothetical protein